MPRSDRVVAEAALDDVASKASADSGGVDPRLLGDFLRVVADAAGSGRRVNAYELRRYRALGSTAAEDGVALRALLDLYLSAGWRLWRHLPAVASAADEPDGVVRAGEVVLRAVDDAVAALAEGYQLARLRLVRAEEAARREFVDDLLSGRSSAQLVQRGLRFGLDLSGPHAVAVVDLAGSPPEAGPFAGHVEDALAGRKGDTGTLVASKDAQLVVAFAAPDETAVAQVLRSLRRVVAMPAREDAAVRIGVGRPRAGAGGIRASFEEARDALEVARRLGLPDVVADARDLLAYRVLLRDPDATADLVTGLLAPLRSARGGARPLLDTLEAYFATGGNAAETARQLHLSVRAVTYRLERIRALTGRDPDDPTGRFPLQVAVVGARLLGWPGGEHLATQPSCRNPASN